MTSNFEDMFTYIAGAVSEDPILEIFPMINLAAGDSYSMDIYYMFGISIVDVENPRR